VGTDGLVHGAEVLKGIHPLLNAEALRVVQALTGFTPGRQNGRPVPVSLTVPVTFQRK
jgi:outer membrane biosynthesis protein TonB